MPISATQPAQNMLRKTTFYPSTLRRARIVYDLVGPAGVVTSLATFQATAPGTFTTLEPIMSLTDGQTLAGLDIRPIPASYLRWTIMRRTTRLSYMR